MQRLDTIRSAGLDENAVLSAGLFGKLKKLKKLHDPITYFVLGILAGFRWDWCFKSPIYWFAIGFTIKWYRARYVFKIPVWDRQPNWNNIITSKEQEKDLKALTCKNCGSTIFIAKTREFFFEGDTGIGGLGCFACGAKGKDNFIQDRDRIVEDVGDMDDYFEYERPLDFVSRAERRKLLKEAQGDEEKANQMLLEREGGGSPPPYAEIEKSAAATEETSETKNTEKSANSADEKGDVRVEEPEPSTMEPVEAKDDVQENGIEPETPTPKNTEEALEQVAKHVDLPPKKKVSKSKKPISAPSSPSKGGLDLDGLDELDMDAF